MGYLSSLGLTGAALLVLGACAAPSSFADDHAGGPGGAGAAAGASAAPAPAPAAGGAAPDAGGAPTATHLQHGQVLDPVTKEPIGGATVASETSSVVSDADGNYALPVPHDTPYFLTVTKDGYWKFIDQQIKLTADATRLLVLTSDLTWTLATFLSAGRNKQLGVLAVSAWSRGNCLAGDDPLVARADGVTFELHGPGDLSKAKLVYVSASGYPALWRTSAESGAVPHAIFYNVPVGVPLTVTMSNAPCAKLSYPLEWRGMHYTSGAIATEPGSSWSFVRAWME